MCGGRLAPALAGQYAAASCASRVWTGKGPVGCPSGCSAVSSRGGRSSSGSNAPCAGSSLC
eukprot:13522267-Heterocapsa_arctica.AAC.2